MRKILLASVAAAALSAGAASAADLPARGPAAAPAPVFVAMNWSGFYVGFNVGYDWMKSKQRWTIDPLNAVDAAGAIIARETLSTRTLSPSGVTGGVQLGYNWQFNSVVVGVEGDLNFVGARQRVFVPTLAPLFGAVGDGNDLTFSAKKEWFGTIRGRFGVAVGNALLYATGGLAVAGIRLHDSSNYAAGVAHAANINKTAVGWTAGAGIEYAINQNWSVKGEYLYMDLGKHRSYGSLQPAFAVAYFHDHKVVNHVARLGLNYRFSSGGGAVVAKY